MILNTMSDSCGLLTSILNTMRKMNGMGVEAAEAMAQGLKRF